MTVIVQELRTRVFLRSGPRVVVSPAVVHHVRVTAAGATVQSQPGTPRVLVQGGNPIVRTSDQRVTVVTVGIIGPQGPQGEQGPSGDLNYTHTQNSAATQWDVAHNLGKFPSVTVVDSGGSHVVGEILYLTINTLRLLFSAAFAGKAYLN